MFALGSVASFAALAIIPGSAWLVVLIALAIFAVLVAQHRRVRATLRQFQHWQALKAELQARAQLDWSSLPPPLDAPPQVDHPYATDLDLTGARSLHHLLDTTTAHESSLRLRERLLTTPPDNAAIHARQTLVRELLPLGYFRQRLILSARLSLGSARRWQAQRVLGWVSQADSTPDVRRPLLVASALAACNLVLFVLAQANLLPPLWVVSFVIYAALTLYTARRLPDAFGQISDLQESLVLIVRVLRQLETRRFSRQPALARLLQPFHSRQRPSTQLRRATWLVSAAGIQRNVLLWALLNTLLPWELLIAHLLRRYRQELAATVPRWLDAWFELETAAALAAFAALNPSYQFPQVDESAVFAAESLGHPLIRHESRVANSFAIAQLGDVILITGSNMSGKSSFLRTIGVNLCLAYAGAPVCAAAFETRLFRLFTSIQVSDSLSDGFSFFYAEVRRLRALLTALETSHPQPLFFLIDEIFRGTNNQERLIGSRAYVRALGGKNGAGVISTHDLELTTLPGPINYHFEDQVLGGAMHFDYTLRPGPSPTTNALKIMRLAGLPVEEPPTTQE